MVNHCAVIGCCSRAQKNSSVNFFRFPISNAIRCQKWMELAGIFGNIESARLKRICSLHFTLNDFDPTHKRPKLFETCLPSLNLPASENPVYTHHVAVPLHNDKDIYIRIDTSITLKISTVSTLLQQAETSNTNQRLIYQAQKSTDPANNIMPTLISVPTIPITVFRKNTASKIKNLKVINRDLRQQLKFIQSSKSTITKQKLRWNYTSGRNYRKKVSKLEKQVKSGKTTLGKVKSEHQRILSKIFTPKQSSVITNEGKYGRWTNEEIARAITLRYKSNPYDHLLSMGFPFPTTRTLQRWTHQISFKPGILYAVLNLLKQEFEFSPAIRKQCVLSFDEMSIESKLEYDPEEDKLFGPKANMNVFFVRGLCDSWKQPISYDFDEDLTKEKFLDIVAVLERCGLSVRANVNDLGGKNRGLWNKLGVKVEKNKTTDQYEVRSSIENPVSGDRIWFFADVPHAIKLLRNNTLSHGLTLAGGHKLGKEDFGAILEADLGELKSHFKLTARHLNPKDKEKQKVSLAVQLFSKKTAAAYRIVHPEKIIQADFIDTVNDWFDMMNSSRESETLPNKVPFGLNYKMQLDLLDRMEDFILNLRVGVSKTLFPFQRGMLISIHSMRGLFDDLSGSSMRISYIMTRKLNQDIAENAFSIIRSTGGYNDNPSPVDAKRRLKLLMLSWGGKCSDSANVKTEDNEPFLTGKMIQSMKTVNQEQSSDVIEASQILLNEAIPETLKIKAIEPFYQSLSLVERFEEGGKEYLAGFVAKNLKSKYPELSASKEEQLALEEFSWVQSISQGGLTIPSILWRNQADILNAEFERFHDVKGKYKINKTSGVLKGFSSVLVEKYPEIPEEVVYKYTKSRLHIRIRSINDQIMKDRVEKRKKRTEMAFLAMQASRMTVEDLQRHEVKNTDEINDVNEDATDLENAGDMDYENECDFDSENEDNIESENEKDMEYEESQSVLNIPDDDRVELPLLKQFENYLATENNL